jgi:hypothetical protein
VTGELFAPGFYDLGPIIHSGICGKYKSDFGNFVKSGNTRNLAKCSALQSAIRKIRKLKSTDIWWYVGDEGVRLEQHLLNIVATNFTMQIIYTNRNPDGSINMDGVIMNPLSKGKHFSCPVRDDGK